MTPTEARKILRAYNKWRQYKGEPGAPGEPAMQGPADIGIAIDVAVRVLAHGDRIDVLEREHAEFYEQRNKERRRRKSLELEVEVLRYQIKTMRKSPTTRECREI